MNQKNKDVIVLGFALFSMFFGAGNLIFPPFLGNNASSGWLPTGIGFVITGVGLTMLGVVMSAQSPDNINRFSQRVSERFSKILGILAILSIGPLLAIPRTAATTYEISVVPILGKNFPIILSSIIFFAITLFFSLNESSVMDVIGKFLTPILLLMIFLIISKAIITPIGDYKVVENQNFFLNGFTEGYQTMDCIASIFFASLVLDTLRKKGYDSKKDLFTMAVKTGIVAGIGLAIVYLGLCYVGATSSNAIQNATRSELLIQSTTILLGQFGAYALGMAMLMACLTTSIGLTSTVGSYMEKIVPLSYKSICIIVCVFSCIASVMGLDNIISISVPILVAIYPVMITLMIMNFFDKYIKNKSTYKGAVTGALMIGLLQSFAIILEKLKLDEAMPQIINLNKFIQTSFPFAKIGMPYIVPSIILGAIFWIFVKDNNNLD